MFGNAVPVSAFRVTLLENVLHVSTLRVTVLEKASRASKIFVTQSNRAVFISGFRCTVLSRGCADFTAPVFPAIP